ncbi:MAG: YafY family transcriptional regulator [Anaerolineae bacterium]|nr:YafY family transcriptional regulator [Anaerolineae bacterium]
MRADRLISLLLLLQTRGQLTARELAQELEVSERTIYRDIEALSLIGVPVYAERGPNGGCALLDNYRTSLTGMTNSEIRALFVASVPQTESAWQDSRSLNSAILKLAASLPKPQQNLAEQVRERVQVDNHPWFGAAATTPFLPLVEEALWQERRLNMTYRGQSGRWVKRLVEPVGLVAKAGAWYMVANSQGNLLVYRVSRIQEAHLTEQPFTRPPTFNLAQFWHSWQAQVEAQFPRFQVTVRVAAAAIPYLSELYGDAIHTILAAAGPTDDRGRIQLTLPFPSQEQARAHLLTLGPQALIEQPEWFQEHLQTWIERLKHEE